MIKGDILLIIGTIQNILQIKAIQSNDGTVIPDESENDHLLDCK
jgi:hypothetical protein